MIDERRRRLDPHGAEEALIPADGVVDELVAWADVSRRRLRREADLLFRLNPLRPPGVVRHRSIVRTEQFHEISHRILLLQLTCPDSSRSYTSVPVST